MKTKSFIILAAIFLISGTAGPILAHEGDENRLRIEIKNENENEIEDNRFRLELRGASITLPEAIRLFNQLQISQNIQRLRIETKKDRIKIELEVPEATGSAALEEKVIEISGNTFEITGKVTSVSPDSLIVAGQIIMLDKTKVPEFNQVGTIETGEVIKVEGIIIDNTFFAREIEAGKMGAQATPAGAINNRSIPLINFLDRILAFFRGQR